jgi:DNA-directed RNA polymerase beta subunit
VVRRDIEVSQVRRRPATGVAGALGKNLLVAFMPWEGYNFGARDASQNLVEDDTLSSIRVGC